ncbi:hypothetical protein DCAR_0102306 [Daucus carota subsp. sativus]|uniref:Uncharacterized protein n=1 Tax=Daucus carota subsp. sativus TaxID=79200 RepID=A0AAF1AJV0_DAUCS|nr:PREDICTED: uncharacterized protein LOC108193263 isoform X1 [Daucus carota subsp. sativus]XP_017215351.1 PREDICTED: uncharacterized protein LOC108193263 isoform X1 [Daucus carota subsp. sativus]WOG83132.1 hypothetical protein DCAR_0102306 [Daucus carota subsp. sativus]
MESSEANIGEFPDVNYVIWFAEFVKRISGHFPLSEDSTRVEEYCGISMRTFRYLCSLVMEPMSNSHTYKFNDNRELTVVDKVAIALRRLKFGKSLNSISKEIGTHSFTADKVTRSFVEALVENGLRHLHGTATATEERMTAETMDRRLKEEWKVLTLVMKAEKRQSISTACRILHNIVIEMNDERHG